MTPEQMKERQLVAVGVAGTWSIFYSVLVFLIIHGWFVHNMREGTVVAVLSTARIIGAVGVASVLHVLLQRWLNVYRAPGEELSP